MKDFEQALGIDPERLAADADRLFARLNDLPGDAVTVRAESADGWVSVVYDSAAGVRDLRLNPRAMRMDSDRLAETILDVLRQAREQAEAGERRRAEERLGAGNALFGERQFVGERLREATGPLQDNLERANATIDRLRNLLRP
ncbi:YbaB/EbfC family nucleoid-associated protein [Nonomuraea sp. PA05]|uniref:YbaB/EbfC family nucleoid-associated protein n=1 Tax=Nonomuraea sp. PA05 TaxID=2604466 RepID=UPI0011D89D71|nr:YbaB/EbfC family nucleoid-associated protein [Nonomuraea sp. PA05]TYB69244.1 YbaB/EbfC family nucleoid-associated protein [Nonomuraea sp. PA05]